MKKLLISLLLVVTSFGFVADTFSKCCGTNRSCSTTKRKRSNRAPINRGCRTCK